MTHLAEPKRFYRSTDDKMIAGVCGGLAEYFNIDPTIVRLITVIAGLYSGGTMVIVYIALAIIVPLHPDSHSRDKKSKSGPILDKK